MAAGLMARAESTWTVTNDDGASNTFTIKRSEKGYAQKVLYRTISLSAYAGQHFTDTYGTLEFLANEDAKTVTVTELTPSGAYAFQNGTTRQYKLEVTDRAGNLLDSATRNMTTGTSVPSSNIFAVKDVTIKSGEIKVTAAGYAQAYHPMTVSNYFNNAAPSAYLQQIGAELRMTLSFQAKEVDDGWQYVQIYANQSTSNVDTGAGDGNPGNCSYAKYVAGFEHLHGNTGTDYKSYTFPVTSAGNNEGATNPWGNGTGYNLHKQIFNNSRASDGRLIIPTNLTSFYIRYNASGSGGDDWYANNTVAHIQAIDPSAPTKSAVSVNPGRHARGNTFYVSVAFSEIVNYTGTQKLNTSWGELNYVTGSGTNVLTFTGVIPQNATEYLSVTGISGTIKDLAGKDLSGGVAASNLCTVDGDLVYALTDFYTDASGNYLIACHDDLWGLAGYVNGGGGTSGKTFLQVADIKFTHGDDWNNASSTENNFTTIGTYVNGGEKYFRGTFDGQSHTISGIRVYRGGTSDADSYQGLFGSTWGATIRNVILTDARITGKQYVCGIVGYVTGGSIVENCRVGNDVALHAVVDGAGFHGGIVGKNLGTVQQCISSATLTVKDGLTGSQGYGGIVGYNNGTTKDCVADGVVIPDVQGRGAIVGYKASSTNTCNYYHNCTVAGVEHATGVGMGSEGSTATSDVAGAHALYAITLPEHVSLVRGGNGTDLPSTNNKTYKTYDNGADIEGQPYGAATTKIRVSYAASIPSGKDVSISVTAGKEAVAVTDKGNHTYEFTMPSADVTVTATLLPVISYIDADGNPKSHACTRIESGTTTYGNSVNTEAWYYVENEVSFRSRVSFKDQQVNIILCDGCTLTRYNAEGYGISADNGSLAIYGQSLGTGAVKDTSGSFALVAQKDIDLNGGNITAWSCIASGIRAHDENGSNITIRRGKITARGSSYGFSTEGTVTLGCATPEDWIMSKGEYYAKVVKVADGQTLFDGNSTHTYSGTLSNDQKNDIARKTLMKAMGPVNYLDENGTEQTCSNFTILADSTIPVDNNRGTIGTSNQDTWYVATGNYTFNHDKLTTQGHVHLILCDDATFTVSGRLYGISAQSLTIYGQREGSGSLVVSTTAENDAQGAIKYTSSLTINGGNVSTSTKSGNGILDGGKDCHLTINGGNVHATAPGNAFGISYSGDITLGWTRTTDRIYVSSYGGSGTVCIKDGQAFSNGSEILGGTITDLSKINGKTLVPVDGAVPYIDADGKEKYCTEYIAVSQATARIGNGVDTLGFENQETWYVVEGNQDFLKGNNTSVRALGHVHLILCDGATFTGIHGSNSGIYADTFTIYGQREGTGYLEVRSESNEDYFGGIYSDKDLTINGGHIEAYGANNGLASESGSVIINGGRVESSSARENSHAIYTRDVNHQEKGTDITINNAVVRAKGKIESWGYVTINGSTVTGFNGEPVSDIIGYYGITLGCSSPTDTIWALYDRPQYGAGKIKVKEGQTLWNGEETVSGTISDWSKIEDKKLVLYIEGQTTQALTAHQATYAGQQRYWTTFYDATRNYILPAGAQAFYMKNDYALYRIDDGSLIPAGCAVVIMADESALTNVSGGSGTLTLISTDAAAPTVTGNILKGTSDLTPRPEGVGAYVLSMDSSGNLGFFYCVDYYIPAHKAYYVVQ